MDTQKKLYAAVAVLVVMGGALYLQNQRKDRDMASHSLQGRLADLPKIEVTEEQTKAIDSISITTVKDDKSTDFVLSKAEGGSDEEPAWRLKQPVDAAANGTNVKSLLDNLPKLRVAEAISRSPEDYAKWGLEEGKALHAVFKKGEEVVLEAWFGESGSRGQMTRIAGKDGVYAVKGYSKWLYERDEKGWRDKAIFKFDDKEAVKVTVENENGKFEFEKDGEEWASKGKAIKEFKASKVDDLLRAYKNLNAADFGDGKKPEEVGLDKPAATVTIELKGGSGKFVLNVGEKSEGSNRWVKSNVKDQVFSISSWAADWATANEEKFQEKKKDDGDEPANPHGGAMPGMPGMMPPGMGAP